MKGAYRHPGKPVPPGAAIAQDQMQPVASLRVKCVIASPASGSQIAASQPQTIRGAAWSGDSGPVAAVDVSLDGGRTWKPAALRADQKSRFGWRQFELAWTPSREAYYTILAKARDSAGHTQPFDQEWNPSGYLWNVVPRVGVEAVASPAAAPPPAAAPAPVPLPANLRSACVVCHEDDVIRQQRLTREQWDREITKMAGWGAKVSGADRAGFLDFLFSNFGPRGS